MTTGQVITVSLLFAVMYFALMVAGYWRMGGR
jgi:hypothetical protein